MKRGIIIFALLILALISMSGVCAGDANDTAIASGNTNQMELSSSNEMIGDSLQTSEENSVLTHASDNESVSAESDSEMLGEGEGTYYDLINEIGDGGYKNLTKSYYRYTGGDAIEIKTSGVINGNGAVIDMNGSNIRAFYVGVHGVTIKNLTIENANYKGNGGALYFMFSGSVENCNFTNNKVTGSNGRGGAVYFYEPGEVTNCNFTNNSALYGGAVFFRRTGEVTNCNFVNNTATNQGGAIRSSSECTVTNCNFVNNNASNKGGAIYFFSESTSGVINSNFTNNSAGRNGGAINFECYGTVENCNFANNTGSNGGAVYFDFKGEVTNCNFTNNTASNFGGAIRFDSTGNVTNCNFINNKATANDSCGGAIYFYVSSTGTVTNCNFTDNKATGPESCAGAIYFADSASGDVINSSFINNTSLYGGAICFGELSAGNVTNCDFINNTSLYGGAILFEGGSAGNVTNCDFINNSAEYGGAIHSIMVSHVSLENCNFTGNKAGDNNGNGGAIYLSFGSVVNCDFVDNLATGNVNVGGAIYMSQGNISKCNFTRNKAYWGGAIFTNSAKVLECNFADNQANDRGGAIFRTSSGTVENCNFADNQANGYGGAVFFNDQSEYYNVSNCNFTNNNASFGGAIYFRGPGEVTGCNFANNWVPSGRGGAIYFDQGNSLVADSVFISNRAGNFSAVHLSSGVGNVSGCLFINNSAEFGVVGQAWDSYTQMSVNNNIFLNNIVADNIIDFADMGNLNTDYNWFGNNATNYDSTPNTNNAKINNWLFLNATSDPGSLSLSDSSQVTFKLYLYNSTGTFEYCDDKLPAVNLALTATNGNVNGTAKLGENVTFTATGSGTGSVTASVENASYTIKLYIYADPELSVNPQEVYYSSNAVITLNYNSTATGNVNITLNGKKFNYTFTGMVLNATVSLGKVNLDEYNVTVTYSGDDTFSNATAKGMLTVNPIVDLSVNITPDREVYFIGDEAVWTVTVYSAGNGTNATDVMVEEFFPSQYFEFTKCNTDKGTFDNETMKWNIGFMENGTNATLYIYGHAKVSQTRISNSVVVGCNETDWNMSNNLAYSYADVEKFNSTVDLNDTIIDYGNAVNVTATTTGATGITAKINGTNATVDGFTIIIPVLAAGNYTLTVTTMPDENHNPATKTVNITVNKANTEIALANETLYLKAGDRVDDVAKLSPADAGNLTFVSSDEDIVLAFDGTILARIKGNATVTVSFAGNENYTAAENKTITVYITPKDASVSVENDTLDLKVDETYEFNPTVVPNFLPVEYSSSNGSVVTVTDYGLVRAVGEGTAIITLTVGNDMTYALNTTNVTVTVSKVATEITLANKTVDLKVNDEVGTGATLTPADAGNLTYASSNSSVAIVEGGKIKALANGTATITVSFAGDNKYAAAENRTIAVTVSLKDVSISLNNSTLDLFVGDNFTIVATSVPAGLNVTFVVDDSGVYDVDDKGVVTALKEGTGNVLVKVGGDGVYAENSTEVAVSVRKVPTEIGVINDTLVLEVTDEVATGATLTPADAGNVTYTISNSFVVKIKDDKIIALREGEATITVSFAGDKKYAAAENKTINVTVRLKATSVSVNNSTLDLVIDEEFIIVATTVPAGLIVDFVPDNSGVVSVRNGGIVTALKEGTATIIVKVGGEGIYAENSTNVTVTVSRIPTEIVVENATLDMKVGDETVIVASLTPAGAGNVTFTSSNDTVVEVDDQGNVIAQGKGQAIITVSFAGDNRYAASENKTITVNVGLNDASVTVDNATLDLKVDETCAINATKHPDTIMLDITYTSSNSSVATVDKKGIVTAVGEGSAVITVEVGDDEIYAKNSTTVTVTVSKIPTEIIISNSTVNMVIGDKDVDPGIGLLPSDAGEPDYISSDISVVVVNGDGTFTAVGDGVANVTVSFRGDEKYAAAESKNITVIVSLKDASVSVENSSVDLAVGDTFAIVATTDPAGLPVVYVPDSSGVVSVDKNGKVTALKAGTAVVTVKVGDAKEYARNSTTVTVTVSKVPTKIAAKPITATYKVNKNLVITLKDSKGNPISGVKLTVKLKGTKTYKTDKNGQVKVSTKGLAPKTYTAKITFNGSAKYAKSAKNVKVTVKKAKPKITAKAKTFKTTVKTKKYRVTLKDNTKKPIKKATLYLKVGKTIYKAKTNSKGKATFKITKLNRQGKYKAVIKYKGNKYYKAASKKSKITVKLAFKTVSKGSKDKATVKKIQRALKNNGYYITYKGSYLMVDGIYEGCTERSVKEFQRDHGLKATGKVDERTAKKLGII